MKKVLDFLHWKANEHYNKDFFIAKNMLAAELKEQNMRNLLMFCQAANKVAIHSQKLTSYQRKKYKYNQIKINGKYYYLFNHLETWSVGIDTNGKIIIE